MAKKYDIYEELKNNGFEEFTNKYGCNCLKKIYAKEIEVAWYGKQKSALNVEVSFNPDHTVLTVNYLPDGFKRPDKTKTHFNQKRAFNAIRQTVENRGFQF